MVNEKINKTCGHDGCFIRLLCEVTRIGKSELCAQHVRAGMVTVANRKCGYDGYSRQPMCGVVGSR